MKKCIEMNGNILLTFAVIIIGGLFVGYMSHRGGFKALFDFSEGSSKRYAGGVKPDIIISTIIASAFFVGAACINNHIKPINFFIYISTTSILGYMIGYIIAKKQKHYEP